MTLVFDNNLLEKALAVEPLPSSVARLAQVATDSESGSDEVAKVLNLDQALLGKVLAEANSASQAATRTIGTAADAVMRLGVARVVALAMSDSVSEMLESPVPEYGLEHSELAFHSQLASIAAERVRPASGKSLPGELVTASLLHDIGKLVIGPSIDETSVISLSNARSVGIDWATAEHEIIGVEHAEVGRIILDSWGLPEEIGLAVQYHHSPHLGGGILAHGVAVCDALAHLVLRDGEIEEFQDDPVAQNSASELQIKPERLARLIEEIEQLWQERTGR